MKISIDPEHLSLEDIKRAAEVGFRLPQNVRDLVKVLKFKAHPRFGEVCEYAVEFSLVLQVPRDTFQYMTQDEVTGTVAILKDTNQYDITYIDKDLQVPNYLSVNESFEGVTDLICDVDAQIRLMVHAVGVILDAYVKKLAAKGAYVTQARKTLAPSLQPVLAS